MYNGSTINVTWFSYLRNLFVFQNTSEWFGKKQHYSLTDHSFVASIVCTWDEVSQTCLKPFYWKSTGLERENVQQIVWVLLSCMTQLHRLAPIWRMASSFGTRTQVTAAAVKTNLAAPS